MSRLFLAIAAELWLRGRLAEQLAQYITSLMRHAAELATPHMQCLLYATYCFRPILSKLMGATESVNNNRDRAPSGPVKVTVSSKPYSRHHAGVTVVSGVTAVLAWSP